MVKLLLLDLLRETQPYLDRLERDGVKLKYIFETHFTLICFHNVDLSRRRLNVYGPNATILIAFLQRWSGI
jgi:hypothetical protein